MFLLIRAKRTTISAICFFDKARFNMSSYAMVDNISHRSQQNKS